MDDQLAKLNKNMESLDEAIQFIKKNAKSAAKARAAKPDPDPAK